MFTYIRNYITNISIDHTDFFIAFFMLKNRAENRTFCIVLKDEEGPELDVFVCSNRRCL